MNIPDHFILKFFDADLDPGSVIFLTLDQGSSMEKFGSRRNTGDLTQILPDFLYRFFENFTLVTAFLLLKTHVYVL